eukprot:TRINITY_DN195_c0_g1_i6.p1 TRINITY_DN195_c0_g1~~TRINITY_DN195_c0_g1_i6.p1  ORF type:complete len:1397 (+),score=281.48 TRINITY_DN195_c0_g1_i6:78-4268(+)
MRKRAHEAWKAAGTALGIVPPQPDEQLPKCTDLEILGAQRYAVTVRWNCAAAVTTAVQLEPEKRMKSLGCGYRPRFYEVRLMDCKQGERIEKREVNPRDPRDTEMCAVVPKLRPGTEYEVSVRASPGPGRGWSPGDWSEPATVTTPAQGPCGADLQAEAADVADCLAAASAMLEWGDQEAHLACNGYASRLCRVLDSEVRSHDYCMFYQNEGNALIIAFASAQNYIRAIAGEPDATRHCALEGRLKHFTLLVQRLCGVPVQAGTSPKPSSRLYDDDTTPEQLLETVISIAPVVNDRLLQPERVLFTGFAGGGAAATDALCEVLRRLRPAGGSPHFPADEPWTRRVRCVTFAAPFQQCRVHSLRFCPLFEHHVLGGDAAVCAPLLTKDQRKALERELRTAAVAANRRPAETSDVTGEDHLHLLGDGCQLRAARRGLHAGSSGLSWQLPPGAVHTLQQGMLRMYTGRTPTCFDGDCAGGAVCSHDSGKVRAQVFSPEDYARALPAPWSDEKNLAPTVDSGTARCVCCDTWIVLHLTGRNLLHTRMVQMQLTGGGTEVMELTRVDAGRLCARMKLQMTEAVIKGLTDGERAEGVVMTDFGDIRFAATMSIDKDLQPVMRHARKYLDMPVGNVLSHALTAAFRDVDMTEEHRQRGARATQYVPPFEMQVMPLDERDASHSLHILFQTGKVAGTDGPDSRQSPRRSEEPTSCLPSWTGEQGGCSVVADEGRWRMRVGGVTWVSKRELECTDWRTGISRVVWPHEMEWVGPPVRVVRRPNDIRERLLGLELVKCICQPDGASRDLLRWLLLPMKDAREPENLVLPDLFDKFSGVDSGHDLQLAAAEAAPRLAAIVALCDALCWFTFKEATVPQVTRFTSEVFLITGGVGLFLGGPCGAAANIAALTCTLGPAAAHVRQCNRMSYTLSKYAEKLDFFLSLLRQRDADAIPAETFYHKEVLVYRAMREALSTKTLIISGRPSAEVALPGLHLHGCIVDSVDKDSPAADHGFVQGMRIVRVNETEVDEPDALSALMKAKKYYEVEVVQGGSDECQAWRRLRECPGRRLSEVMTLFDFFVEIKSRWTYLFGKPHEWRPNLRPAQQIAGTFDEQDTELFVGLMWAVITTHELRASLMEFFELHVIGHKNAGKSTLVSATFGVTTKSGGSTDGATLLPVQYTVPGMEHFRVVDGAGSNDARTRAGSLQVLGESQCASHHLVLASHAGLQEMHVVVSIAMLMVTKRSFTLVVSRADTLVAECARKCPAGDLGRAVGTELRNLERDMNAMLRGFKAALLQREDAPTPPEELVRLMEGKSPEELRLRADRIFDLRCEDWLLVAVDPNPDSMIVRDLGADGLRRLGVHDVGGLRYRIQSILTDERPELHFPAQLPTGHPADVPLSPRPDGSS